MSIFIKCRILDVSENNHLKLKDIPRGETFRHFGHEWIVLEHDETNHTLVLSKETFSSMSFDINNCNNWAKSTIRERLNGNFLKEMCKGLSPSNLGFSLITTDLTADDGLKDYGESIDTISLLTCDLYRKHRDIIEPVDECWWLATPTSTTATGLPYVRYVDTFGALSGCVASYYSIKARPLCYLSSEIVVRKEREENA